MTRRKRRALYGQVIAFRSSARLAWKAEAAAHAAGLSVSEWLRRLVIDATTTADPVALVVRMRAQDDAPGAAWLDPSVDV